MGDNNKLNSNNSSLRSIKESKHKKKITKEVSEKFKSTSAYKPKNEAPHQKNYSMGDLMRKRHYLKEELKQMAKRDNKRHTRKRNADIISLETKKSSNYSLSSIPTKEDLSPNNDKDYDLSNSEDEEYIINQRRKKRQQLIEKLTSQCNESVESIPKSSQTEEETSTNTSKSNVKDIPDMFSETETFKLTEKYNDVKDNLASDDWDDSDGYYNIRIGDVLHNKYVIKSILGKGVFSNVVCAYEKINPKSIVAVKIIRNNDLMYMTSLKEVSFLKEIKEEDPESKYHCLKFFEYFMHRGHLCLVVEPLFMDLRAVIKKYGRHGLNMKAITSYSRQLLLALKLLKKLGLIHADIKPDNILVNEKKNILKLCDFGSASKINDCEPTPYLVSRFYRAPEIILGLPYGHSIDIWSTACTIYEMATGRIMFLGSSNNKMLKCFMDLKGKFPGKLIRKGKFRNQHFNYNNNLLLHKKDENTGREKFVEFNATNPSRDLLQDLKKHCKNLTFTDEKKIPHLKDLLDKMTIMDPNQRISLTECFKHPFITDEINKSK